MKHSRHKRWCEGIEELTFFFFLVYFKKRRKKEKKKKKKLEMDGLVDGLVVGLGWLTRIKRYLYISSL